MNHKLLSRPAFPALFPVGIALMLAGCLSLVSLVKDFQIKRLQAMTIGEELPALRSELSALQANVALEQTYGAGIFSRYEEQAAVYILPEIVDSKRVAGFARNSFGSSFRGRTGGHRFHRA